MSRDDWLLILGIFWLVNLATWLFLKIGDRMYKKDEKEEK